MSLVSPLLASDYSVDCSASTCYCLLSCEGDSLLPCQPGMDWLRWRFLEYQYLLSSPFLYLLPDDSSVWMVSLSALARRGVFPEINLTWANVPRSIQGGRPPTGKTRPRWVCVELRDYIGRLMCIALALKLACTYADARAVHARASGEPDFPVGWSVMGRLFKGKVWAKEILAVRLPWQQSAQGRWLPAKLRARLLRLTHTHVHARARTP